MMKWAALAIIGCGLLAGCAQTEVSAEQDAKNKAGYSAEGYEAEMIKQGKSAQLEAEKKAAAAHDTGGGQGQ